MDKVKILCLKTLAVKEIDSALLKDYLETKDYVIYNPENNKNEDKAVKNVRRVNK